MHGKVDATGIMRMTAQLGEMVENAMEWQRNSLVKVGGEWRKIKSVLLIYRDQRLEINMMIMMKRGNSGFGETMSEFRAGSEG